MREEDDRLNADVEICVSYRGRRCRVCGVLAPRRERRHLLRGGLAERGEVERLHRAETEEGEEDELPEEAYGDGPFLPELLAELGVIDRARESKDEHEEQ